MLSASSASHFSWKIFPFSIFFTGQIYAHNLPAASLHKRHQIAAFATTYFQYPRSRPDGHVALEEGQDVFPGGGRLLREIGLSVGVSGLHGACLQ